MFQNSDSPVSNTSLPLENLATRIFAEEATVSSDAANTPNAFVQLGIPEAIAKALTESGYTEPTAVQAQAIPAALAGRNLIVSSKTGSGKTAAFMLPALTRFSLQPGEPRVKEGAAEARPAQGRSERGDRDRRPRFTSAEPRMLVLVPTRELAQQVTDAAEKYGKNVRRLRAVSILGGMPYPKQLQLLSKNPEILVATPGRLIDHIQNKKIDLSKLEILVLDEADRMLDMGFVEDIEMIANATPATRQTLLFSATLDGMMDQLAKKLAPNAQTIKITGAQSKQTNIAQHIHMADDQSHKNRLLEHCLRDASINQAIVFTSTKRDSESIADQLADAGFATAALHGDMHQGARNRTLTALRQGRVKVLVATDVAARGIDISTITHVFNYDLPRVIEDYVHRIGRTGRAGRDGVAISLAHHSESAQVKKIERFTQTQIPVEVIPGLEPKRSARPDSNRPRSGAGFRSGSGSFGGGRPSNPGAKPGGYRGNGAGNGGGSYTGRSEGFRSDAPRAAVDGNRAEGYGANRGEGRPGNRSEAPRRSSGFGGDAPRGNFGGAPRNSGFRGR